MTDQPIGVSATSSSPRSRALALAGGVLAAALAALAAVVFLGSDGSDEAAQPILLAQAAEEGEATDEINEGPLSVPTVTYDVYLDRDPFEPVLQEAEADSEAPDEPPTTEPPPTGGTIVVDPDTGQLIVVPAPSATPTDPGSPPELGAPSQPGEPSQPGPPTEPHPKEPRRCNGEDEMVCEGRVVSLLEVQQTADGPRATFQVDTTTYQVVAGQDFAISFRLLSVDGTCATLLYGDERNTLCLGQHVMK